MKKTTLLLASVLFFTSLFAQDFPGYRAGNYTGVNGVFFNPASIADSRYQVDFNFFSFNTFVGNNRASFSLKNLSKTFSNDSLEDEVLGKNPGPSSGFVNLDWHGPSMMFGVGKKGAMALTTRLRATVNIVDLDGKLIKQLSDDANNDLNYPYTISSTENMRVSVNAWTEYGVSYARVLRDEGPHFLKGGLTVKYLAGAGNGYVNIDHFNATVDDDPTKGSYLRNTTGGIGIGFGGIRISDVEVKDITKMISSGVGGDIGFVYEYRPDNIGGADRNKYKVKVGLAVLDIGQIKYKKDAQRSGDYTLDITGTERLYLDQLDTVEIDDYNNFFKTHPQYFTPAATNGDVAYHVSLPTTLRADVDYHLKGGLYVNVDGQVPLSSTKTKAYNSQYYSSFTITPRYEGRFIGVYVPLQYSSLTHLNAGVSLRVGPLFVGSGSVLTALIGESKQADVHFGLRLGILQKKEKGKRGRK